jgi:hypothetical protein
MRNITTLVLVLAALLCLEAPASARSASGGRKDSTGHYRGGKGSSHKNGKYKNPKTDDHYAPRKK